MKLLLILLLGLMLMFTVAVSGCTAPQSDIQTADEASDAISNVSGEIGDIQDILSDIDRNLG
jgi:hypothetical protein